MATFTFDGTSSITATKDDTVFISANPQSFTQATDNGNSVTLAFGSQTITITGTTLSSAPNNGLPNVFVTGGQFAYGGNTANTDTPSTTGNVLSFLVPTGGSYVVPGGDSQTANSKIAIFGGLGRTDAADLGDSIGIGGKGSTLVYSNAGNDTIFQTAAAFDSTSTVNVYGDGGADSVILTSSTNKASIFVSAGSDSDVVTVVNSGSTTIYGGLDSTDGNDTISFNAAGGASGTSVIFGNGGDDSISVGGTTGIDSTSTTTIYGGFGNDKIAAVGTKATISIIGGEGTDSITVSNTGSTFITGGNQSGADQSLDGADSITFTGSGNAVVFGNVGNDTIGLTLSGTDSTVTSNVSVYGGKDNDLININATATGKATIFAAGGENSDNITVAGNGGAVTIYGGVSASDSADGADTITYSNSGSVVGGVANIYGNGGADSISINGLGTSDSTNATTTVYGGGGADSITVAAQSNTSQSLVLNGNEGSDTFTIAKGTGQSVTVGDFAVGSGNDKLVLTGTGAANSTLQVVAGTFQTLQQALDKAAQTAGAKGAAAVVFSGSTYVVAENNTSAAATTFDPTAAQAIKLTGVTDLVGLVGSTTIAS